MAKLRVARPPETERLTLAEVTLKGGVGMPTIAGPNALANLLVGLADMIDGAESLDEYEVEFLTHPIRGIVDDIYACDDADPGITRDFTIERRSPAKAGAA